MDRVRYTGTDEARDVALPGGLIRCDRMKWVDLEARAGEHGIRAYHVAVVQHGLLIQDDWEAEGPKKAARTRRKHAIETVIVDPAVPDEEQDK